MIPTSWRVRTLLVLSLAMIFVNRDARLAGQPAIARPGVAVTPLPSMRLNPTPGDFNRDGRIDLIAGRRIEFSPPIGGELVVRLGNGDGTFGAEQVVPTPAPARPLAVGDLDGDGALDVVVIDQLEANGVLQVRLLRGAGDGTFGAATTLADVPANVFGLSANAAVLDDIDGDGHPDLALTAGLDALRIYAGNGDFTFKTPVTLTTGGSPAGLSSADVNGDGRRDLLVAARDGHQVDVFVNRGGLAFGLSTIPVDRAALAVTTADLNRDGRLDLLVTTATEDVDFRWTFHDGRVLAMAGNGDGTFQPAAAYDLPRGPLAVTTGDFNRDGIVDVATMNHTAGDEEECGPLWLSVSILAGDGGGGLASAASFQLSYVPAESIFLTAGYSLFAAHIDADGQADLVAPGGVLLNRVAVPNRAPAASAGPDRTITDRQQGFVIEGQASDPDNDLLSFRWTDENSRLVDVCLQPLVFSPGPGEHTYTLVVRDDRFGVAADNVTVTDASTHNGPGLTMLRPTFGNSVPAGAPYLIQWNAFDPDGGQIVDIDISVDRHGQLNFTPIASCTNLSGTTSECLWSDPGPVSDNAALLFHIVDSQGDVSNVSQIFRIVDAPSGALPTGWSNGDVGTVGAAGAAGFDGRAFTVRGSGADIWDAADEFHWAHRSVTGDFEVTARAAQVQDINPWTKAGLMIRESAAAGARHASIFATPGTTKPVSFQRRPVTGGTSLSTGGAVAPPPVWLMLRRTGDTIAAFYRTTAGAAWTALDSQTFTGLPPSLEVGLAVSSHVDGTFASATFDNVTIATPSTVAPVPHVLRPAAGEEIQTNAPYFVRWTVDNADDVTKFNAFFSDGPAGPWLGIAGCFDVPADRRWCVWDRPRPLGAAFIKVETTTIGGRVETGRSEAFQIVAFAHGASGMPPGWSCGDAGTVGAAGSCRYEVEDELSPDFIVNGSGADIWGTADQFSFASYAAYGNFSFTARVVSVQNVNRWTKAGLMIRDWNGQMPAPAGARHASFFVTPSTEKGTAFQRRPADGGVSVHTAGPVTTAPVWLKLVRTGDTIRAYSRLDAASPWVLAGEQTFEGLPDQLSAMLVVSSHVDGTLASAHFDNVRIEDAKRMQSVDIGGAAPGTTVVNGPEITMEGDGADIWGTADAFRFHYMQWNDDVVIVARVRSLENTNAWSKAGVMVRESLGPGSRQIMAIVSASRGLAMQSRSATGGTSVSTTPVPANAPVWIMLQRLGDDFTASYSFDGESWQFLGQVTMRMSGRLYVGLPVTSHAPGALATAVFDEVSIRPSFQ